jgi:hypothetical protein
LSENKEWKQSKEQNRPGQHPVALQIIQALLKEDLEGKTVAGEGNGYYPTPTACLGFS